MKNTKQKQIKQAKVISNSDKLKQLVKKRDKLQNRFFHTDELSQNALGRWLNYHEKDILEQAPITFAPRLDFGSLESEKTARYHQKWIDCILDIDYFNRQFKIINKEIEKLNILVIKEQVENNKKELEKLEFKELSKVKNAELPWKCPSCDKVLRCSMNQLSYGGIPICVKCDEGMILV